MAVLRLSVNPIETLLGSNCLEIWQFFRNFLAFQKASFQHFTSTIGTALSCQQWFLLAGRCEGRETTASNGLLFHRACAPRDITFSCKKHQQNNNFARSSQSFVHFFPFLHDYDVKKMSNFAFFMENVNKQGEILFSFESGYGP